MKNENLEEKIEEYKRIIDESRIAYYRTTKKGMFVSFNHAFLRLLGFDEEESNALKLIPAEDFYFNPEDREKFKKEISKKGFVESFEVPLRKKDGSIFIASVYANEVDQFYRGWIIDNTHTKIDARTGVYRPEQLGIILETHKRKLKEEKTPFALYIVDFDWFKFYNESYGYEQGNRALKTFGTLLRKIVKKGDNYLRFGGEEFVVIKANTDKNSAVAFVENFMQEVENTKIPIDNKILYNKPIKYVHGTPEKMTVSVGVVCCPYPLEIDLENIILYANEALLEAKTNHKKNTYVIYNPNKSLL